MSTERPRGGRSLDLGSRLKEAISAAVSQKFREQPEAFAKLVELGLVEPDVIADPRAFDLGQAIRQFRDRIGEIAQDQPSVLAQLEVRPLEVMRGDESIPAVAGGLTQVPLTVVFSDLEGFTSFTRRRGDLEAGALLRDHYETVDAIVRSRGGSVIKKIGDGHMLSFHQPAAAVMAALDLVRAAPGPLRLRAGAHVGPVVQTEDDLVGHVVNVASRVTDLADGGISLVTAEVRDGAGRLPHIGFAESRTAVLAGLDEPVEICEVVAA
jgi:class 3 adenylate cyclase